MSQPALLSIIQKSSEIRRVMDGLAHGLNQQMVTGLSGLAKSCFMGALGVERAGAVLILSHSPSSAEQIYDDLVALLPAGRVGYYPGYDLFPHEEVTQSPEQSIQRMRSLEVLLTQDGLRVVVAPVQAFLRRLPPPAVYRSRTLHLRTGDEFSLEKLAEGLVGLGYERVEMVEERGEFSLRGGIVDVFTPTREHPFRLEFFGNEVDSIRTFETGTQRSVENQPEAFISPAREIYLSGEEAEQAAEKLYMAAEEQAAVFHRLGKDESAENLRRRCEEHHEKLLTQRYFPGMEQYLPLVYRHPAFLTDYLPEGGVIVLDEPGRMREALAQETEEIRAAYTTFLEKGDVLPGAMDNFAGWDDLFKATLKGSALYFSLLGRKPAEVKLMQTVAVPVRTPELFYGRVPRLMDEVERWREEKYYLLLVAGGADRVKRLREICREYAVPVTEKADELQPGQVLLVDEHLSGGCEFPALKLIVLTETEIYGQRKKRRATVTVEEGARLHTYTELKVGDYVVHVNHGIGQYAGVETMEIAGVHRDYLIIKYAGEDKLFVPTEQVHLLQKYVGSEGVPPKLYKLGGGEWTRVKNRVKASVQDMAEKLLKLYAEREQAPGHAFAPDTVWQKEFEENFGYDETPDQLRAVQEIKEDMEKAKPMDRLLCGDVGYGKTEVAIRAAFKAVMDGKQVAVLVPTTILAQQHYTTFSERFSGFPIRIKVLSRFQTAREQNDAVEALKRGEVDVIIGTHRLLSKDVIFRDLGLLIIDEEQRFGVAQKERLKELRKNVDVLTLTATPIPRTLHMAMAGVRDMSLIQTPPEGRYPIRTYVLEYDEKTVREVILREMNRQGQVYLVYNRVQTIEKTVARLQELVPEARIGVAHGQMDENHLERVMMDFLNGEYDVLICTTIIESGLDIPNVNTLIVYDADHLGLAQLYQLRGRVGRSNRVAYAYFMYRRDRMLSQEAEKRLEAIREFTELGSGFKIAMRDLEIRGAGNLLGAEQHGFIASVGFELYCRLLEEAVQELKGEKKPEPPVPTIDLTVDAYLPDEYIADPRQKIGIYKKIAAINGDQEAADVAEELLDRYGDLPEPVANLLAVARIKALAWKIGVSSINSEKDYAVVRFIPGLAIEGGRIFGLTRKYPGRVGVFLTQPPQVHLRYDEGGSRFLRLTEEVLREIASF